VPPRIVLGIGAALFATILAVAFYYSPMHFGLDRWRATAAFDQGVRHDQENKIDQAIERYDRAIALDPDLVQAYNNRGSDRRRKGNLDSAIADYGEVIRLLPDSEAGYFNRAVTWQMKGDVEAALSDFATAISRGHAQLQQLEQHLIRGRDSG
jgi:tetratricopeptide (TPR) repeat protein